MKIDLANFGTSDGIYKFKRRLTDMDIFTDNLMEIYLQQYNADFLDR